MLFTLIWIACSVASATQVYRWVDENGVTHYSDQPHANAAKVEVREPTTYPAKRGPPQPAAQQPEQPGQPLPPPAQRQSGYDSCSLAEPTPDQVFLNAYAVTVVVSSVPALHTGDRIIVTLDGRPQTGLPGNGSSFTITPIDRGTHSVEATIQDQFGTTLCQTRSATFHVRQPSVFTHPKG